MESNSACSTSLMRHNQCLPNASITAIGKAGLQADLLPCFAAYEAMRVFVASQ